MRGASAGPEGAAEGGAGPTRSRGGGAGFHVRFSISLLTPLFLY